MRQGDRPAGGSPPATQRPFVIGLTGPIAAGKSTVAEMLGKRGATFIDADEVYKSLLAPESDLWHRLVERFGLGIVGQDNEIDRAALGEVVFRNPDALADLDAITHPAVVAQIRRLISHSKARVVVLEALKLVQAGLLADVDRLWYVNADPETRWRRLVGRTGLDAVDARARVAAGLDSVAQRVCPDVVFDNTGDAAITSRAVDEAWRLLGLDAPIAGRVGAVSQVTFEEDS